MRREALLGWALIAPSLLLLGIFVVGPVLLDVPLSLMQYDMIAATGRWVGLGNYQALVNTSTFGNPLQNSANTYMPRSAQFAFKITF